MIKVLRKLKNKFLNTNELELEEDLINDDLNLDDICFYDEDGELQELLERRNTKIINFYKNFLIFIVLVFMFFLLCYSLTFNFLFIIFAKIILIIVSIIVIVKPKEMCEFIEEIWNA